MAEESKSTEQKILDAAGEVFQSKGFDGARMQEIAHHAGINKGLLHYYFKTKDALFDAIFGVAIKQVISRILSILEQDLPLADKIHQIVDQYMELLLTNPGLPRFVLNELNKHPDKFVARHLNAQVKAAFGRFAASVAAESARGNIRPTDARHLFANLLSLLIFPFIGRPMLQTLFALKNEEYKALLQERKAHIKAFMDAALAP